MSPISNKASKGNNNKKRETPPITSNSVIIAQNPKRQKNIPKISAKESQMLEQLAEKYPPERVQEEVKEVYKFFKRS